MDDELRAFAGSAPHGAARVTIERYRKHTGKSRAMAVMDDLLGGDEGGSDGPPPPAGLRLSWVDAEGRPLRVFERHPVATELEDALLPALVAAAGAAGAEVDIVARHRALTATPRVMDRLTRVRVGAGRARAEGTPGYREAGAAEVSESALDGLRAAGFDILSPRRREFAIARERTRQRSPAWLLFIPLIIAFAPVLVVLDRGFGGVSRMLRETFARALTTQRDALRYAVEDASLVVTWRASPAAEQESRLPLADLRALGFGPAAFRPDDSDQGRLRAVLTDTVLTLPHQVAAPDTPNADATTQAARASGAALRAVIAELV